MEGWISLHRKMVTWEWYNDPNTLRLFLHCLLKANHTDKKWRGIDIERGSFVTSYGKLSKELELSVQNIRTSIANLKLTGELTSKSTSKNTVIKVVNYGLHQTANKQTNKQVTSNQQASNKQVTTTNNDNNDNKDNKDNNDNKEINKPTAFNFRNSFLDLGVNNDILNDWLAVRKKKGSVNSKTAFNLFVNEVKKSKLNISQAVEMCAGRSWASYKVEYDKDNKINKPQGEQEMPAFTGLY